ncbi:hypothetical protein KY326_01580, partial [Candidatus Woesearchaeota archaeon]|nr:hypothetical protein [Candidatus Woesearchaeota archaeon]
MLNKKRGQKRGQITIYIIIGLVILIVAGLIIYLAFMPEKEIEQAAREELLLPASHRPVQAFIEDCLSEISEDALKKLGAHGGWISIEDPLVDWKEFNINLMKPTESDVVSLDRSGKNLVPYWWHMKSEFKCYDCFSTQENIPSMEDIEDQLNYYIEKNLPMCLQGFSDLEKQGFDISELDNPLVQAIVTNKDVIFILDYPLKIAKNELEVKTKYFRIRQDVNLRKVYNLALQLTYDEIHGQRLENFVLMNLITVFSGADFSKLPPITSSTTGFATVFWAKPHVELMLKDLIATYVPFLQVDGTAGAKKIKDDDPVVEGTYNTMYFEVWQEEYPEVSVNYFYNDWPIDFDITPPEGPGLLKAQVYRTEYPFDILPPFQRNLYEFFYDVAFPVVIELYDSDAFDGKGYSFFIAHEANIKDNKNMLDWNQGEGTFYWDPEFMQLSLDDVNQDVEIIDPMTGEMSYASTNVTLPARARTLFDNPEQRIVNVTIHTYDRKTGDPLDNVAILFGCGFYSTASISVSQDLGDDSSGYIGKVPVCVGDGRFEFSAPDYRTLILSNLSAEPGKNIELEAYLDPVQQQEVRYEEVIKIISSGDPSLGTLTTTTQYLQDKTLKYYEQAMISFNKVKEDPYEREYSQLIMLTNSSTADIELIPGKYEINIMVTDKRGVVIWPETRTYGSGDEEQTVIIP